MEVIKCSNATEYCLIAWMGVGRMGGLWVGWMEG